MFGIGNKKAKQAVVILTAKGIAEHKKGEVGTLCFAFPDSFEAWELGYSQQARRGKTGEYTQFVSSLNKQPLKIYEKRPQLRSQSTRSIAAQQFDEKLVEIHKQNQNKTLMLWLCIFAATLLLIIGLVVLSNMRG